MRSGERNLRGGIWEDGILVFFNFFGNTGRFNFRTKVLNVFYFFV